MLPLTIFWGNFQDPYSFTIRPLSYFSLSAVSFMMIYLQTICQDLQIIALLSCSILSLLISFSSC